MPDHRRHGGRKTLRLTSKLCWQTSTDSSGGRGPASGCCPASRCRAADCRKASASVLSGPSLLLELDIEEHGLRGETHAISVPDAVAQRQAVGVVGLLAWLNVTGVLRPHCLPFLIFAWRWIGLLTLDMRARLSYCERVDRAGPVMGSRRTSRIGHSRNFVALGQVDEDTWKRVQVAGRVKSIAESRR